MDFQPQVPPEHYSGLQYDSKDRFISYWTQIDQVVSVEPKSVLEVGIGNGFVHRYLKSLGVNVHTLDADARLGPDTVGSVLELPFGENAFDATCCFETLEHLPFEKFSVAVRELARVAERSVLLSLPDVTPYFLAVVEVGFKKKVVRRFFDLPAAHPPEHRFDGEHYWEVGKKGYPLARVIGELEAAGLVVEQTPRIEENPWHRFFRCKKERKR
jgi:SAM-dependent methyltransferase